MKPRYTDAFWGEHPFDGHMILIKNKNKNKNIPYYPIHLTSHQSTFIPANISPST